MNSKTLVLGANGQVGKALNKLRPDFVYYDRDTVDLSSQRSIDSVDWTKFDTVINAAAYTAVDKAEDEQELARSINAIAVGVIAEKLSRAGGMLIHFSSDYVFDGVNEVHDENERPNPQSVYGETKHQGDIMALSNPNTYVIRTSWVIGDGNNFARTMLKLAKENKEPAVVNDQFGRPTMANLLARFSIFLTENKPETGVYNLSNDGPTISWFDLARKVFELSGRNPENVSGVLTEEYFKDKPHATRPKYSTLSLEKTKGAGFTINDWRNDLEEYINEELQK